MAADPTRSDLFRKMGFAVEVDTVDPPGKSTVTFDVADLDRLLAEARRPRTYADGLAEGRRLEAEDAQGRVDRETRAVVARQLLAANRDGGTPRLMSAIHSLAASVGEPTEPRQPPSGPIVTTGPSTGPMGKGKLR